MMTPAFLANMAPPFLRFWPGPNPPISRRWLGDHKTVGGFVVGALAGLAAALLLSRLPDQWMPPAAGAVLQPHWPAFGVSMGLAALTGDSLKSFFKRRLGIASGKPWIPFDQLDFIVASLAVLAWWTSLSWIEALAVATVSFFGDLIVNQLSYRLGIKKDPW